MKFNIWTLLFQVINFAVLLVILRRILYKPVRAIMEKRRALVEQKVREAEGTRNEALALKDKFESAMKGLEERKARMLDGLQEEVQEERKRLIEKAREEAGGIAAREKALLLAEKRTFEAETRAEVIDSAALFSENLMKGISDEALHQAVFRKFIELLKGPLPGMAEGREGTVSVELATAYPLAEGDVEQVKDMLRAGSGRTVDVAVTIDQALIAGVRMKAGDKVVDASLAGQIRALQSRLKEQV
jgi:F-type H+-transporting ATPase subunit b